MRYPAPCVATSPSFSGHLSRRACRCYALPKATETERRSGSSIVNAPASSSSGRPNVSIRDRIKEYRGGVPTQHGTNQQSGLSTENIQLNNLRDRLSSLFLPEGYPRSVSEDYLEYQLWTVPTHVLGWLSHSLSTSSLLKAVGINAGPVGATATAAAIKWIIKDGIGSAGRFLVGGRFGVEFDDDPRRWRMVAEGLTTAGLALEISTSMFPAQFLLLASLGNFVKAVAKSMGKPVFRVIQTHFAADNNVGAVAAKEEVWEVVGQLLGYAASIALLKMLEDQPTYEAVVGVWAASQAAHVALRYKSLSTLKFDTLNQKRACALTMANVRGQQVPSVVAANRDEPMLLPASSLPPAMRLGVSLQDALGATVQSDQDLEALMLLYSKEQYLLIWRDGTAYVVLKQGHSPRALLRAVWQAAWLTYNQQHEAFSAAAVAAAAAAATTRDPSYADGALHSVDRTAASSTGSVADQGNGYHSNGHSTGADASSTSSSNAVIDDGSPANQYPQHIQCLSHSLKALDAQFEGFVKAAQQQGWKVDCLQIKTGNVRIAIEPA